MRMLILGGTALLGRATAGEAAALGHDVTCLARGSSAPPDGVEFIQADRDLDDGLAQVAATPWDAVIDVSRQPGHVRRAVRDLTTPHRVFVSSGNVYSNFSTVDQDEDAGLLPPLDGDVMESMESYGPAKVACEDAVRGSRSSWTIVRSGLIGGPGDTSGRTGYWPWRFAHPTGIDVIAPDQLDFPCAIIDVRDLAAWIVHCAEMRVQGTYNATGPTVTLELVLAMSAGVARSDATVRPVSVERLRELGVQGWMGPMSLPLWIDDLDWRGFATMNSERARREGLLTRPLDETLADTLTYEDAREDTRQAGLTDDEERRVRDAL